MIPLLFITVMILFIIIGKLRVGRYSNPLTYYLIFWVFWIIVGYFNIYDLYIISKSTYLMILLNILGFSIGFILFINLKKIGKDNMIEINIDYFKKKITGLLVIINIILLYYLNKYNNLVDILSVEERRMITFKQGYLFDSYLENLFYTNVIRLMIYILMLIIFYNFIINNKKDVNLLLLSIAIFVSSAIGNGRMLIFDAVLYIFLIYVYRIFINNNRIRHKIEREKINKKKKIMFFFLACVAIYAVTKSSANRLGLDKMTIEVFGDMIAYNIEQGIIYFTGPFVALDQFFQNNLGEPYLYGVGRATLAGVDEIIWNIFNILGIEYVSGNAIVGNITGPNIYIGNAQQFNAFFTSVMNFYVDAGVMGVGLFSAIQGASLATAVNYFCRNKNIFSYSLMVFLSYGSIVSAYRFPSSLRTYLIIVILIFASIYIKSYKRRIV